MCIMYRNFYINNLVDWTQQANKQLIVKWKSVKSIQFYNNNDIQWHLQLKLYANCTDNRIDTLAQYAQHGTALH